jgi:hypothetical protein
VLVVSGGARWWVGHGHVPSDVQRPRVLMRSGDVACPAGVDVPRPMAGDMERSRVTLLPVAGRRWRVALRGWPGCRGSPWGRRGMVPPRAARAGRRGGCVRCVAAHAGLEVVGAFLSGSCRPAPTLGRPCHARSLRARCNRRAAGSASEQPGMQGFGARSPVQPLVCRGEPGASGRVLSLDVRRVMRSQAVAPVRAARLVQMLTRSPRRRVAGSIRRASTQSRPSA